MGEVLRSMDWLIVGASSLLVLINLAMLFSSGYQEGGILTSRFGKQLLAYLLSLALLLVLARIPYHSIRTYVLPIYGLALLGLVAVSITGSVIKGAISRFSLLGLQLQPSEFMKVALIIGLAWLLPKSRAGSWRMLWTSGLMIGAPVLLILIEPDLGVASLIICFWGLLMIFEGLPWLAVAALTSLGVLGSWGAWEWVLRTYQKDRLLIFLDPMRDPLGAGYNIVQSIVAFGSGRIFGRGIGYGPQSQLQFLPERHTDFILASVGEELGFIGVTVVVLLYVVLLWRILDIARHTQDPFGRLIAVGTFIIILISFVVSVGMNMGVLPVTGIPLPFLSYGGSNLLSTFLLLGLVQSVRVYSKWVQAPPVEISDFA